MNKMVVGMLAVWTAAFASAGALAFTFRHAPAPKETPVALVEVAPVHLEMTPPKVLAALQPQPVIVLREVRIVGQPLTTPRPAPAKVEQPAAPRDLHQMNCSAPKGLALGPTTQTVRYCE